jgi:hypothetical protein
VRVKPDSPGGAALRWITHVDLDLSGDIEPVGRGGRDDGHVPDGSEEAKR